MRALHPFVVLSACLAACDGGPTATVSKADSGGADDSSGADGMANASFNVAIESSSFGETLGRCEVQVAFYTPTETDGFGVVDGDDGEDGEGDDTDEGTDTPDATDTTEDDPAPTVIPRATTPGTCEYAAFDPDVELPVGAIDVRGSLSAGPQVSLTGDRPVTLEHLEIDGGIRYAMPDCSRETYPFSMTFGIEADGDPDGVPAFSLDDAVVVGPDVVFTGLPERSADGGVVVPAGSDFTLSWEELGDPPAGPDGPLVPERIVTLVTARRSDHRMVEALGCMPDEAGSIVFDAATLAQMTETHTWGEDAYTVAGLNIEYLAPSVDAPWGEVVNVRSRVGLSGHIQLE